MSLAQKIRQIIENVDLVKEAEATSYADMSDEDLANAVEQKGFEDMIVRNAEGMITNRDVLIRALETVELDKEAEEMGEEVEDSDVDFDDMSDSELRQMAYQAGLEDSVTLDGEGGIANRDEVIAALKGGVNESAITEAGDEDEVPEEGEEAPAEGEEVPTEGESIEDKEEGEFDSDDLSDEEGEDEPEVTVVVVSPELQPQGEIEDEEKEDEKEAVEDAVKLEHIEALTSDDMLSEEYKQKAKTIFEAALTEQAASIKKSLQEEFDAKAKTLKEEYDSKLVKIQKANKIALEEAKKSAIEDLSIVVDGYMTHAVESWVEENAVQLERNVRAELTEQFIDGLKNLFVENYIEVPEEKFDIVKAQEDKIAQLEESIAHANKARVAALKEAAALKCEKVLSEATEGLTDTQKARFESLIESVEFETIEQFEKKVKILRESYFKSDSKAAPVRKAKKVLAEQVVETETKPQETNIDKYAQAITKIIR